MSALKSNLHKRQLAIEYISECSVMCVQSTASIAVLSQIAEDADCSVVHHVVSGRNGTSAMP